ncbi:MAG: zinc ribbon domain-containing protein [Candidatus Delongbacteria bacterium]|nr:zinc ribbon domain-containing protein [Candidatus Delongbacteria bacterium]
MAIQTNCINCGAALDPNFPQCRYCGTYQQFDPVRPYRYILQNHRIRTRAIYPVMLIAGLVLCGLIYGVMFDQLSEERLMILTPAWFFLITFGLYGYTAEKVMAAMIRDQLPSMAEAYRKFQKEHLAPLSLIGMILSLLLIPMLMIPGRSSIRVAFWGSLIWGIMLVLFFQMVFPNL